MINASNRIACNSKECSVVLLCNEHIVNIFKPKNCNVFAIDMYKDCKKMEKLKDIQRKQSIKFMEQSSPYTTTADHRIYGVWTTGTTTT